MARLCTRLGDAEFRDSDAGKHEYEAEQDEENSSGQVDVCDYSAVGDLAVVMYRASAITPENRSITPVRSVSFLMSFP